MSPLFTSLPGFEVPVGGIAKSFAQFWDQSVTGGGPAPDEMKATQLRYAFGYLLYPMRIRVECAMWPTRHAIVIGAPDDAAHTIVARVSDVMTLVERK